MTKSLILLAAVIFLGACGANAPFERGRKLADKSTLISKPTPNNPPTTIPPVDPPPVATNPNEPQEPPPVIPPVNPPAPPPVVLEEVFFNTDVKPLFKRTCSGCHDNPAPTFQEAAALVVPGKPEDSELYKTATGQGHRKIWAVDSPAALKLAAWIKGQRI